MCHSCVYICFHVSCVSCVCQWRFFQATKKPPGRRHSLLSNRKRTAASSPLSTTEPPHTPAGSPKEAPFSATRPHKSANSALADSSPGGVPQGVPFTPASSKQSFAGASPYSPPGVVPFEGCDVCRCQPCECFECLTQLQSSDLTETDDGSAGAVRPLPFHIDIYTQLSLLIIDG